MKRLAVFVSIARVRLSSCLTFGPAEGSSTVRLALSFVFVSLFAFQAGPVSAVVAAEPWSEEKEDKDRWSFEVFYGWTTIRGNDHWFGDVLTYEEIEPCCFDANLEPLITEMGSDFVPLIRGGYRSNRWGVTAEFWTLDTEGSADGVVRSPSGFENGLVVWDNFYEATPELSYRATNSLSLWTGRVALTRVLTPSLNLGVGVQFGKFDNPRSEYVLEEIESDDSPFPLTFEATYRNEDSFHGFFIGPSIALDGNVMVDSRARVSFVVAQSLLFADAEIKGAWESRAKLTSPFGLILEGVKLIRMETSRRVAVPVTDLRGGLSFDLWNHVSIGIKAFLSIWIDMPLAPGISLMTGLWQEPKSTLVFVSVGPVVALRF